MVDKLALDETVVEELPLALGLLVNDFIELEGYGARSQCSQFLLSM